MRWGRKAGRDDTPEALSFAPGDASVDTFEDTTPVVRSKVTDYADIGLLQSCDVEPKARGNVQAGARPMDDVAVSRARRSARSAGQNAENHIGTFSVVGRTGEDHGGSQLGDFRAGHGGNHHIAWIQSACFSRFARVARRRSARSSSLHASDHWTGPEADSWAIRSAQFTTESAASGGSFRIARTRRSSFSVRALTIQL